MASLKIENVGKKYGEFRAISNVTLSVEDGEFLVLVGPSGCGKSTLLRMIAGLESLTEGRIFLGERDVSDMDPKDRDVAMVFQNYALYPHMTVFENMVFGLQQRNVPKGESRQAVLDAARILDLEPLLGRKPGTLSGGQRQRVAMGRAIVRSPAIYLMDEPLSNLDAKLRVKMRAELKLLRSRLGVTTVYVTHDQVEAMTLGDRVAVLSPYDPRRESNLQQCDIPQKLYLEPFDMFVAGFIGSPAMNFLYANIAQDQGRLTATIPGTGTVLRLTPNNTPNFDVLADYAGERVVLGIRPEFFALAQLGTDEMEQPLVAEIKISELVGPDAFLYFDLPTPDVRHNVMDALDDVEQAGANEARFTARVSSDRLKKFSGEMKLYLDMPRLHYFETTSNERIT